MISDTVGAGGANRSQDVHTVKSAIVANGVRLKQPDSRTMDADTIEAIRAFQREHGIVPQTGVVGPRSRTLVELWPVAYANPTGRAVRGTDGFGSGKFGAGRGDRIHDGADYIAVPGQNVTAPMSGRVSMVVPPYRDGVDHDVLSGVQIDASDGSEAWVFYIEVRPGVVGSLVRAGRDSIGVAHTLQRRYPGITDHVHVRIHSPTGRAVDPETLIR